MGRSAHTDEDFPKGTPTAELVNMLDVLEQAGKEQIGEIRYTQALQLRLMIKGELETRPDAPDAQ